MRVAFITSFLNGNFQKYCCTRCIVAYHHKHDVKSIKTLQTNVVSAMSEVQIKLDSMLSELLGFSEYWRQLNEPLQRVCSVIQQNPQKFALF